MDKYIFIELKAGRLDANEVNDLITEAIQRADETLKENVEDNQIKSKAYNTEWNDEFSNKFYIASTPGSLIDVQVTNDGQLQIKFKDRLRPDIGAKLVVPRSEIEKLKKGDQSKIAENLLNLFNRKLEEGNNLRKVQAIKQNVSFQEFGSKI